MEKLYIPGPIDVSEDVLKEMAMPPYSHRSNILGDKLKSIEKNMKNLLNIVDDFYKIFIFTSSGTGVMEACARNCIKDRCLCISTGAFGAKWHDIIKRNGKEADLLEFRYGSSYYTPLIRAYLDLVKYYDSITVTHNETSTGVENNLNEIKFLTSELRNKGRELTLMVDAVSSIGGIDIDLSDNVVDVIFSSSQKCLGVPPGLAVAAVSKRALERSRTVKGKGLYFDFIEHEKCMNEYRSLVTPAEAQINALAKSLENIINIEGKEARFRRHKRLAEIAQEWTLKYFDLFADRNCLSDTVTCVKNNKGVDLKKVKEKMKSLGYVIDTGYPTIKIPTFRIAHMGDRREEDFIEFLDVLTKVINK